MSTGLFFFDSHQLDRNLQFYPETRGVSIDATGGRGGTPCLLFNHNGPYIKINPSAYAVFPTKLIMGYDFKPGTSVNTFDADVFHISERNNLHVRATLQSDGLIRVYDADNVLRGTSLVPIVLGAVQFMDFRIELHSTLGVVELIVEGERFFRFTGLKTKNSAAGLSGIVEILLIGTTGIDTHNDIARIGNIYLMDGSAAGAAPLGRAQATLQALASDVATQWSRSTGATNFGVLDDIPPSVTDYAFPTAASQRDRYSIAALADPLAIPFAVRVSGFAQKTDSVTRKYRLTLRDGGDDANGPDIYVGGNVGPSQITFDARPAGAPWSRATINALTAGPESRP